MGGVFEQEQPGIKSRPQGARRGAVISSDQAPPIHPSTSSPRKAELVFVSGAAAHGRELLLDTCVYIDVLQGRTPIAVDTLLRVRTVNHLSVCLAELMHAFGRLDPLNPATEAVLKELARTVADIPQHRLAKADSAAVIEAGILAGLLFRPGDLRAGQELAALNDATLYLHALSHGQVILTCNLRDFDLLNQILPDGQVMFYERGE